MLILSRKPGQRLVINDNIIIHVLGVSGDIIKLGIEAPKEVTIHRHEVFEAIKEANRSAAISLHNLPALPKPEEK